MELEATQTRSHQKMEKVMKNDSTEDSEGSWSSQTLFTMLRSHLLGRYHASSYIVPFHIGLKQDLTEGTINFLGFLSDEA